MDNGRLIRAGVFAAFVLCFAHVLTHAQSAPVPVKCVDGAVEGGWSFSSHPFMGEGYQVRPIVVTAVRTIAKTLTANEVRIRNISSKSASSIKLGWSITRHGQSNEIVKTGESGSIPLKRPLAHLETELLTLPLFSFIDLKSELESKNKLSGDFSASIWVSQIWFEDNSHWKVGDSVRIEEQKNGSKMQNILFQAKSQNLSVVPLPKAAVCPKQQCKWIDGPPPGYTCATSENDEYCTNCVTSCCNTICTDPSPSCGPCN